MPAMPACDASTGSHHSSVGEDDDDEGSAGRCLGCATLLGPGR